MTVVRISAALRSEVTAKKLDGTRNWKVVASSEGRKAEAFAENPNVAIEMDCGHEVIRGDYTCSYSFAFSSIMGNGRIRMVENEEEKRHGLTLLMQHVEAGAEIEFLPHMLQRVAVYCIEVSEFTGKHREKKGQTA